MSHPTDVVGYTADADTWCVSCTRRIYGDDKLGAAPKVDNEGNEVRPIFADAEFDAPVGCRRCGIFLETDLSGDGVTYALDMIRDSLEQKRFTNFLFAVANSMLWMGLGEGHEGANNKALIKLYIAECESGVHSAKA